MEDKYEIKEFNKGVLTLMKNSQVVVCAYNAQPYVSGANAIGHPHFSNTGCGSWCPHFEARGNANGRYEQVLITCGCREKFFDINNTELHEETGVRIVSI